MKRLAFLVLLPLAGCGTNPPPVVEAKALPTTPAEAPATLTAPPKPAKSDDAGAKLLAEVLAAHGGADKVNALRTCSFTRKGTVVLENGREKSVVEAESSLRWPDRYRYQLTIDANGWEWALNPTGGWARQKGGAKLPLDDKSRLTTLAQSHEDSVSLLFALTDPAAVVRADGAKGGVLVLHLWAPGVEYALLGIDPETKLLKRFRYVGREDKIEVVKELVFHDHEVREGVKLGQRTTVLAGGRPVPQWDSVQVKPTPPADADFAGP